MRRRLILWLIPCLLGALFATCYLRGKTSAVPEPLRVICEDKPTTIRTCGAHSTRPAADPEKAADHATRAPKGPVLLLTSDGSSSDRWTSSALAAKRVGWVYPGPALLAPAVSGLTKGDRLALELFDDTIVEAEITSVTQHAAGTVGLRATFVDGSGGSVYMASSGGELRMYVDAIGSSDYLVKYDAEAEAYRVIEVDQENSECLECATCKAPTASAAANILPDNPVADDPVALADVPVDSTVIDVMVVYTPAALAYEGSVSSMNANIALAIERANAVHANSETYVQLSLVHSAEIPYVESGDPGSDLDRLTYVGDGYMDAVHNWRNSYDADLVCLLESNPGTAGMGWVLNDVAGDPAYGFSLAQVQVSDWSTTVAHELAHNMGCGHSKGQASNPGPGLYSYAAGWQWADTASYWDGFSTVMTYQDFDGDGYGDYEEIPYFSTPSITYTGNSQNPVGHAVDGDNVRCIRNTRYALRDYRVRQTPITTFPYTNSFEQGFCDWAYYNGDTSWVRDDGTHPVLVANVPNIATTSPGDGDWFLVIDPYGYVQGAASLEARFDLSTLLDASFGFSYCNYSWFGFQGMVMLQVSTNAGVSWLSLWSNTGESDNAWRSETVDLDAYAGLSDGRIRFEVALGSMWYRNLACLDAFSLTGSPDADGDGLPDPWTAPPLAPENLSPSGGVFLQDAPPLLSWEDPQGHSSSSRVYVVGDGGAVVDEWVTGLVYQVQSELASGDYQWAVRGQNAYGLGDWSAAATFTIEPELPDPVTPVAAPSGTLALGVRYPEFEWNAVAEATWYHIVATRVGQGSYMEKWVQAPATNWQSSVEFVGGDYNWWIQGWSPAGFGPWSDAVAFTIPSMQPSAPSLVSPTGGVAVAAGDVAYQWEHDTRATWYQHWYRREGGDATSSWYEAASLVVGGRATLNISGNRWGVYDWYVRGWGPDGMGDWSSGGEFVSGKTTPVSGDASQLTWDDIQTASAGWYQVHIDDVTGGGRIEEHNWWFARDATTYVGGGYQSIALSPFLAAGDYEWSIRAWSSVHGMGPWSETHGLVVP